MNIIDWVIILIALAATILGAWKGVSRILLAALALVCGIGLASRFHHQAGEIFGTLITRDTVRDSMGFALVFLLTWIAFLLLGVLVARLLKKAGLGWLDKTVGGAVGLTTGILFLFIIVMVLTALLPLRSPLLTDSSLSPLLVSLVSRAVHLVPEETQDRFIDKLEAIKAFWENRSPQAAPGGKQTERRLLEL